MVETFDDTRYDRLNALWMPTVVKTVLAKMKIKSMRQRYVPHFPSILKLSQSMKDEPRLHLRPFPQTLNNCLAMRRRKEQKVFAICPVYITVLFSSLVTEGNDHWSGHYEEMGKMGCLPLWILKICIISPKKVMFFLLKIGFAHPLWIWDCLVFPPENKCGSTHDQWSFF